MSPFRLPARLPRQSLVCLVCLVSSTFITGIGAAIGAEPSATFSEIRYPKKADQSLDKTDEVQRIAQALHRSCAKQTGVAWKSVQPIDDLPVLASAMMGQLSAFDQIVERPDFPGKLAGSRQRLYLAESRASKALFTFLWTAGKNDVSLQICGDTPAIKKPTDKNFPNCAVSANGGSRPLGTCPLEETSM